MSKDKAREIIAESVAKEVVESIGEDLAGALVEYANLVKQLAEELNDEQLEDSDYIKNLLSDQLPNWDWEDWYDLLVAVRKKKRQKEHEEKTAEVIYNEMPYFAQEAAERAVSYIVEAARNNELFKANKAADQQADILWTMFYCMGVDIKMAAKNIGKKIEEQGFIWGKGKYLIAYIEELREIQWENDGEVTKLRTKENK